jgi:hypothetical protein
MSMDWANHIIAALIVVGCAGASAPLEQAEGPEPHTPIEAAADTSANAFVRGEEGDRDHDGLGDAGDRCPDVPEDRDGDRDEDGCPEGSEGDRDGDGLSDVIDRCPDDAEDHDDFEDVDGCPDPDNDQVGVRDADDRCPNQAMDYPRGRDGCPS